MKKGYLYILSLFFFILLLLPVYSFAQLSSDSANYGRLKVPTIPGTAENSTEKKAEPKLYPCKGTKVKSVSRFNRMELLFKPGIVSLDTCVLWSGYRYYPQDLGLTHILVLKPLEGGFNISNPDWDILSVSVDGEKLPSSYITTGVTSYNYKGEKRTFLVELKNRNTGKIFGIYFVMENGYVQVLGVTAENLKFPSSSVVTKQPSIPKTTEQPSTPKTTKQSSIPKTKEQPRSEEKVKEKPTRIKTVERKPEKSEDKQSSKFEKEKDCKEIKREWDILVQKYNSLSCDALKNSLDILNRQKQSISTLLKQSQDALQKAQKSLKKYRDYYQNIFESRLKGNPNYRFSKPKKNEKGWWYMTASPYNMHLWFKDGKKMFKEVHKIYQENAKEIYFIMKKIEQYYKKVKIIQIDIERYKKILEKINQKIKTVTEKYNDCLRKKEEMKKKLEELAKAHKDCLENKKLSQEIQDQSDIIGNKYYSFFKDLVNNTSSKINKLSKFNQDLLENESELNALAECNEFKKWFNKARKALSNAYKFRVKALKAYEDAQQLHYEGKYKEAKEQLAQAEKNLKLAEKSKKEADYYYNRAKSFWYQCKQKLSRLKLEKERKQRQKTTTRSKKQQYSDSQDIIKKAIRRAKTSIKAKPYFISDKKVAFVTLYGVLPVDVNDCDCPKIAIRAFRLFLAQYIASSLISELGIGTIKAFIDAASPDSAIMKITQFIASNVLGALGSESLSEAAMSTLQSNIISYILPKSGIGLIDKPASSYANANVSDLLKKGGIKIWKISGDNFDIPLSFNICEKKLSTNIDAVMMYNPHTRRVLVLLKTSICPKVIQITYQLNEDGLEDDSSFDYQVLD